MKRLQSLVAVGLVLALAGLVVAQTASRRALVVNGKTLNGAVVDMDGRSYVDIETLAQALNGEVTLASDHVVLSFPTPTGSNPTDSSVTGPPAVAPAVAQGGPAVAAAPTVAAAVTLPDGLSRDFMSAAIAELAEMREWRGAVGAVITFGIPVTGSWPQDYRDRVSSTLDQASVAASNGADHDALTLLQNEFGNLQDWAAKVVSAREALNAAQTIDPNALQNDTALAKISACGGFLNSMIVSGTYADNASCH